MLSTPERPISNPSIGFEDILIAFWEGKNDPSHDLAHIRRVLSHAKAIHEKEGGDWRIIEAAIWFHDLVNLPKDHPERDKASRMSAEQARPILSEMGYDAATLDAIGHAIEAHSFSANITPLTLEARILQDADRLDSLGAIGIARTFSVSGALGRSLFHPTDPKATDRDQDDRQYGLDHFPLKLFKIADSLHTAEAKKMAEKRISFMKDFYDQIADEIEII